MFSSKRVCHNRSKNKKTFYSTTSNRKTGEISQYPPAQITERSNSSFRGTRTSARNFSKPFPNSRYWYHFDRINGLIRTDKNGIEEKFCCHCRTYIEIKIHTLRKCRDKQIDAIRSIKRPLISPIKELDEITQIKIVRQYWKEVSFQRKLISPIKELIEPNGRILSLSNCQRDTNKSL